MKQQTEADDAATVGRLIAHDPVAMKLVYDMWSALMYTFALALVAPPAAAEEVVLEAYLMLWRQPDLALMHHDSLQSHLLEAVLCDAHQRHLAEHDSVRARCEVGARREDAPTSMRTATRAGIEEQQKRLRRTDVALFILQCGTKGLKARADPVVWRSWRRDRSQRAVQSP